MLDALRHRRLSFAIFAIAVVVAALSPHILRLPSAHMSAAPLIVGGVVITLWIALTRRERHAQTALLTLDATRLAEAVQRFGARVEAWLVAATPSDDLEAEALRRTVVERHMAFVATIRAHLEGRNPHDDTVVQAMTREKERKGRNGPALLQHFAALQREALSEAQRRGFLGEARLLALDEALFTLSAVTVREPTKPDLSARALCAFTAAYAALLVLGQSQRLTAVAAGALVGATLLALEALTTTPDGPDLRIAALASVIEPI